MRRHSLSIALGVLIAAAALTVAPSLPGATTPAGAVANATATPAVSGQPSPLDGVAGSAPGLAGGGVQSPASLPVHGRPPLPTAPSPSTLTGYVWPLPNGRVTNGFGPNWFGDNWVGGVRFHDGLDIATFCGDRIGAAHAGVVLAVGRKVDPWMGWIGSLAPSVTRRNTYNLWGELPIIIVIDDGNGYRSIYAHFSQTAVKVGQVVQAGQFIGCEGRTGFATGCHLHYGLFSPYDYGPLRPAPGRRQADQAAGLRDRPDQPAPGPAAASRARGAEPQPGSQPVAKRVDKRGVALRCARRSARSGGRSGTTPAGGVAIR